MSARAVTSSAPTNNGVGSGVKYKKVRILSKQDVTEISMSESDLNMADGVGGQKTGIRILCAIFPLLLFALGIWYILGLDSVSSPAVLFDKHYNEKAAKMYIQYARASCCRKEEVEHWDCGPSCDAVPADASAVRFIGPGKHFDVQGYVAALPEDYVGPGRHCVIAFRGTVDLSNLLADTEIELVPWPDDGSSWCANCKVTAGFKKAYRELHDDIMQNIHDLGCEDVSLTGHSLGGAMAVMTALELRARFGFRATPIYTFGAPRAGNNDFAQTFAEVAHKHGIVPPAWRVVHYKDPVPRLNGQGAWIGQHITREVYYNEAQDTYHLCSASDGEDPSCAWPQLIPWVNGIGIEDLHSHLNYMNTSKVTCKSGPVTPPARIKAEVKEMEETAEKGVEAIEKEIIPRKLQQLDGQVR